MEAKFDKGEIIVKGAIDAKKIHTRLQKWSKKKVELVSETKSKEEEKKVVINYYDSYITYKVMLLLNNICCLLNTSEGSYKSNHYEGVLALR